MTKALANAQALPATADSKGLRIFGFAFGAVTAAVVLVACVLVHTHADGRLTRTDAGYGAVAMSSSKLVR